MTSVNAITAANRVNIPAVCRIPGRGSAVLVSSGVLLTAKSVVGTKQEASRLTAVFFESGKKAPVEVRLLPDQYYFCSVYPDYLDYCLVACETQGIYGVAPVKMPLVRQEWQQVREGDTLLLVQHPVYDGAAVETADATSKEGSAVTSPTSPTADSPVEVKRFEEVIRRRDDVLQLKAHGKYRTAGAPAFNDNAELVGLQAQYEDNAEGIVSRVVSIITVVKHLFANAQLFRIQQKPVFNDIWDTWYIKNDTTRIVAIMANFKSKDIARPAAERLCEHTTSRELLDGVVACGATKVIIQSIDNFQDDEEFVSTGLRSLWNISFSEEDNRKQIVEAGGIDCVLRAIKTFTDNEQIAQYGTVVLFNLTLTLSTVTDDWIPTGLKAVLNCMCNFESVEVIQKFGIGFFVNATKANPKYGLDVMDIGGMDHMTKVCKEKQQNEYLAENFINFVSCVAGIAMNPTGASPKAAKGKEVSSLPAKETTVQHPALVQCVTPLLEIAKKYPYNGAIQRSVNAALWGLGNDANLRVDILTHPLGLEVLKHSIQSVSNAMEV